MKFSTKVIFLCMIVIMIFGYSEVIAVKSNEVCPSESKAEKISLSKQESSDLQNSNTTLGKQNQIDASVKVGDKILGLTVKKVELYEGRLNAVHFLGEIELVGKLEWDEYTGDGAGYIFIIDKAERGRVPYIDLAQHGYVLIIDSGYVKKNMHPPVDVKVKVTLNNFSTRIGQIRNLANIVKVVAVE